LFLNVQIDLLNIRWGRIVAAIQPHHHTGMATQAVDLIAQRLLGDFKILRLPARPAFPEVATTPASHHQNSLLVSEVEELPGFKLAFEADRV
jgi:hypothetical protein